MKSLFIGIDVSKDRLDLAFSDGRTESVVNDDEPVAALAARLAGEAPERVVLEATGGYEQLVLLTLFRAGLAVVAVNPRQVRDFAKAMGRLAKTDRVDAKVLCVFAERMRPEVRPVADDASLALQALMQRRGQIVQMLVAEKNRLQQRPTTAVRQSLQKNISFLSKQLKDLDRDLDKTLRKSPLWRDQVELLESVPGVGPTTALMLITHLPELGKLTRKQIASLVGVAPRANDSGRRTGQRTCWGGRADVRTTLYMATTVAVRWNPPLRTAFQGLKARGKAFKVAIVACMRRLLTMLNAMTRANQPWDASLHDRLEPEGAP